MNKRKPTAWQFVWNNGRFFSSKNRRTINNYKKGAVSSFGKDCGKIKAMFEENPYIVEGKV